MQIDKIVKAFGGCIYKLSHASTILKVNMKLNVFLPPKPENAPVLFYLAGLTCTGDNGLEKGGFLGAAAQYQIALIFPDTSPRTDDEIVDSEGLGEHSDWDFGSGASFYLNATMEPWSSHYQMESYIVDELPKSLSKQFSNLDWSKMGLMGHSMGGHGALMLYLNHNNFLSCSAFAPISNPTQCDWGRKAFKKYLGSVEAGAQYDAAELIRQSKRECSILVDQGMEDPFLLDGQLRTDSLLVQGSPVHVSLRKHEGYDHSYFFISTFASDHISWHAKILRNTVNV